MLHFIQFNVIKFRSMKQIINIDVETKNKLFHWHFGDAWQLRSDNEGGLGKNYLPGLQKFENIKDLLKVIDLFNFDDCFNSSTYA